MHDQKTITINSIEELKALVKPATNDWVILAPDGRVWKCELELALNLLITERAKLFLKEAGMA